MDLDTLWRIIDEGSTPAIALIAYLIWKMDKRLGEFIAEVKAEKEARNDKLDMIHSDVTSVIRNLAGLDRRQG